MTKQELIDHELNRIGVLNIDPSVSVVGEVDEDNGRVVLSDGDASFSFDSFDVAINSLRKVTNSTGNEKIDLEIFWQHDELKKNETY